MVIAPTSVRLYPQRPATRPSWAERAARQVGSGLLSRVSQRRAAAIVALTKPHGQRLRKLSNAALGKELEALRTALARGGNDLNLVAGAFAVVREQIARTIGLRLYDEQLLGGALMLQGNLIEMETGQGKTVTATLPASVAALAGVPVHIVTANDYLANRDAQNLEPVYEALGLRVGAALETMPDESRREAYQANITFCTGKQLVFDYLRDRVALASGNGDAQRRAQRLNATPDDSTSSFLPGLLFCIVDEADSVLIDDARTPMVLSRAVADPTEGALCGGALEIAATLTEADDYHIDRNTRAVVLTENGERRSEALSIEWGGLWSGRRRRNELVRSALTACRLLKRDRDYLVGQGQVRLVDETTGRVAPDRAWENGLQQMVEIKEGLHLSGRREPIARTTYQQFFRRYLKLCGMSGTLHEVRGELRAVYGLETTVVPPHHPTRRHAGTKRVYFSEDAKHRALVSRVRALHATNRPILVGTRSVQQSERLAQHLIDAGLAVQVLNAKQDSREARLIARAGQPGAVTVATNMAGRGTDIKLSADVVAQGGLHVIVAAPNEAARIDRQLVGRCARQGEPGSFETMLSLDDDLVRDTLSPRLLEILAMLGRTIRTSESTAESTAESTDGPATPTARRQIPDQVLGRLAVWAAGRAQRQREGAHAQARGALLKFDESLHRLLAFAGGAD